MNFSIRVIIRGLVAPRHRLSCSTKLWKQGLAELARRGEGSHESGAFLLGIERNGRRRITKFAYYDDFDPHCLDTGIVIYDGAAYAKLWALCRETGLSVVADVHTHGWRARQSPADRDNPMIAQRGHVGVIVPRFAQGHARSSELGVYEYLGQHTWRDMSGDRAHIYFYIGIWG